MILDSCIFLKMNDDEHADQYWTLLMLHMLLQIMQLEQQNIISLLNLHLNEQRRLVRSLPERFVRPTWNCFVERTSSTHFYRMFRMISRVFSMSCECVETAIGIDVFKSEYKQHILLVLVFKPSSALAATS